MYTHWASLVAQMVKNLPAVQEIWVDISTTTMGNYNIGFTFLKIENPGLAKDHIYYINVCESQM